MDTTERKYTPDGMRLTDCCGAFSTYFDDTLVCKGCFDPVGIGQGDGTEYDQDSPENVEKMRGAWEGIHREEEERERMDALRGYTDQEAYDHENPAPLDPPPWETER